MNDPAPTPAPDVLVKDGKTYLWDVALNQWVRSYDHDEKVFSRDQIKAAQKNENVEKAPRFRIGGFFSFGGRNTDEAGVAVRYAKDKHGNEQRHSTYNRQQRRAARAITRGRHFNPELGKMVPGTREIARQIAEQKFAEARDFERAIRAEAKAKGATV